MRLEDAMQAHVLRVVRDMTGTRSVPHREPQGPDTGILQQQQQQQPWGQQTLTIQNRVHWVQVFHKRLWAFGLTVSSCRNTPH